MGISSVLSREGGPHATIYTCAGGSECRTPRSCLPGVYSRSRFCRPCVARTVGQLENVSSILRAITVCLLSSRTVDHAMRAEQRLILHGAEFPEVFDLQLTALSNVRSLIYATLASRDAPQLRGPKLYLQRRVFTKVSEPSLPE